MIKANNIPDTCGCPPRAKVHLLTVAGAPAGERPNPWPVLPLKGRWLEQCGFSIGRKVLVTVEKGRLIIEG